MDKDHCEWTSVTEKDRQELGYARRNSMLTWQRRQREEKQRAAARLLQDQERAHQERLLAQQYETLEVERRRTDLLASQSKYAKGMLWSNVFLASLTLVLALAAFWQAYLSRESLEIAKKALASAEESAEEVQTFASATLAATKKSAEAATKSAEVSEQTLKMTQRASLVVGGWDLAAPMTDGERITLKYVIRNVGPTEAVLVQSNVTMAILENLPDKPTYKTLRDEGLVTLGSQQIFNRQLYYPTPAAQPWLQKLENGALKLFVYGFFEYRDIFGETQSIPFCVRFEPRTNGLSQCAQPLYHQVNKQADLQSS